MQLSGNRGEWSEIYTFFKSLADGKLYAVDENLNQINDIYYNILQVIRQENKQPEYKYDRSSKNIKMLDDKDNVLADFTIQEFNEVSAKLLSQIKKLPSQGKKTIPLIEQLLKQLNIISLKAPSSSKSDITIKIHDVLTNSDIIQGFSIKSQLGSPSTLINAGKTTNFIYQLENQLPITDVEHINAIKNISQKVTELLKLTNLSFIDCANAVFKRNLKMIDTLMPKYMADILLESKINNQRDLSLIVNSLNINLDEKELVVYKVKQLLMASALGMNPGKKWSGEDEATGGYIIVKQDGNLGCYHLYNRNALKNYLYNSTFFESASTSRHDYGKVYEEDGKQFFKLNLQVRFKA